MNIKSNKPKQWLWFIGIWMLSITTLSLVSFAFKALMRWAGLN